jgi:hypothetical protein
LWDAPNGGNRLYWGQLVSTTDFTTPLVLQVSAGDITRFSAGTLGVQASTGAGGTASIGAYLPLAGGQMAGPLLLAGDPTDYLEAATKQYVDAHSGSGGGPGFLPLSGGTMLGPLNWTATGGTTSRAAQDRAADYVNLKDFGAVMDGTANDSTAYAAARTAANARGTVGGVVVAPPGSHRGTLTPPPYVAPPVLWKIDGQTFGTSGTTPVTNITSGDLVESFFGGGKYYQRTDANGVLGAPVMRIDYTGPGTPNGAINLNVTNTDANFYSWGITSVLNTTLTGPGQAVGFASEVTRKSGAQPLWLYFGHYTDQTGLGKGVLGTENLPGHVLAEIGATQNGPDIASSSYAPETGGRVGLHFANANYTPPSWAANHAYVLADEITPGNGFTYLVTVAGTSGATAPTWPVVPGTVTDGGVTWKFQTTVKSSISRMIDVAGPIGIGAALNIREVSIYDAGIEMSGATLDTVTNPNAAAIRIAANMPIDFSGNGTAAGQNQHYLQYTTTGTPRLRYVAGGTEQFAIGSVAGIAAVLPPAELIFQRSSFVVANGQDFRFRRPSTATGGTAATLVKTVMVESSNTAGDGSNFWGLLSTIRNNSTIGGGVVGGYMQAYKIAGSGSTQAFISDVWDQTGNPSSVSGSITSQEWDLNGSGADDGVNGDRFGGIGLRQQVHCVFGQQSATVPSEYTAGIWFGTQYVGTTSAYVDSLLCVQAGPSAHPAQFRNFVDSRGGVVPTGVTDPLAAIRMSAGHVVDFNGGPALNSAPGAYLQYRSGKLYYVVAGVDKWSVDASGNIRAAGTITGSVTP